MKKLFLFLAAIAIFSSCTHTVYSPEMLEYNYNLRMKTKNELLTKSRVKIYYSENEIEGDFEVISINLYNPVFKIPIVRTHKKQVNKKFLQRAATKADKQGGNGILITTAGYYKVINILDWNTDNVKEAAYVNPILDQFLMSKFVNGDIIKASKANKKRYESSFMDEIKNNIRSAKTIEEADFIKKKLDALEAYSNSAEKSNPEIVKFIAEYRNKLDKARGRINKKSSNEKSGLGKLIKKK